MKDYYQILKKRLSPKRYNHCLGVADTAAKLALKYGVNSEQARMAGLLHDIARELPSEELLDIASKADLIKFEIEKEVPVLLHGPVGALILKQEIGIKDSYIIQAIARHTVGAKEMTQLDKIIYLSDIIEPSRNFEGVETLRQQAESNLEIALLKALEFSIMYVVKKGQPLHPETVAARNHILLSREGID